VCVCVCVCVCVKDSTDILGMVDAREATQKRSVQAKQIYTRQVQYAQTHSHKTAKIHKYVFAVQQETMSRTMYGTRTQLLSAEPGAGLFSWELVQIQRLANFCAF
jgi:hypothetical protein